MVTQTPESHLGTTVTAGAESKKPSRSGRGAALAGGAAAATAVVAGVTGYMMTSGGGDAQPAAPPDLSGVGTDYVCNEIDPQVRSDIEQIFGGMAAGDCIMRPPEARDDPEGFWFIGDGPGAITLGVGLSDGLNEQGQHFASIADMRAWLETQGSFTQGGYDQHSIGGRDAMCADGGALFLQGAGKVVTVFAEVEGQSGDMAAPGGGCAPEILAVGELLVSKGVV